MTTSLTRMGRNVPAKVAIVNWAALSEPEQRRLREFGLDEGVEVELIKRVGWLGGPAAVRIGRMTVGLRRHILEQIEVTVAA